MPAEPRAPAEATRTFGLDPAEEALLAAAAAQADCRPADAFEALALWLRTWPEHALAPEATLRLGEVYGDPDCPCHDPDAARAAWQRVLDAWPTTASAALARGYLDAPPDLPGPGP